MISNHFSQKPLCPASLRARLWLLVLLALLLAGLGAILSSQSAAAAAGPLCYVDADATGAATGDSWADAYPTVQDALADANCTEIWVAEGVYYPDEGAGQTNNVITSTFALTNGVALYGGFDGTETQRDQRDPAANITVLSGDIDQNDITDPNGVVTTTNNITGTNAYHVVTGSGTDNTAVLDGFTVTAGQANGSAAPNNFGGGVYNDAGSPTLTSVTFSGNAAGYGGGMYNSSGSSPALTEVTFSGNLAFDGGGMFNYIGSSPTLTKVAFSGNSAGYGGGMCNWESSNPTLTKVAFSGNSAGYGGGMCNYISNPTLRGVTFSDNSASAYGGGMYNTASSNPTLTEVTFSTNSASLYGGGMSNYNNSSPTLMDVTFSGNSASRGGGMYNDDHSSPALTNVTFSTNSAGSGGGMSNYNNSSPALMDVTFSGNSASTSGGGMFNYDNSSPTLTNTIIANSTSGGDCVNGTGGSIAPGSANNLIEDSAHACGLSDGVNGNIIGQDPNLSALTDYGGPGKQVCPLLPGSPAVDAGTNTNCPATDQRGQTRPVGAACDIGAFELGYNLTLSKQVDNPAPWPGQTITFTIVVTNIGPLVTNGLLSDTLPAGLNFLGPITLEPAGAGNVGTAPPTLASGLTISSGQRITVAFPVTVSWGLAAGTLLTNTATVSATQVPTPTQSSTVVTVGNAPPAANAGAPQTVAPGDSVTLDGSASSDPNGDSLTYLWQQTGGVTVTLSNTTAVSPTFTAPSAAGVLTFTLTVTDTGGLTDTAATTVTVRNLAPTADAGAPQTVNPGDSVTLDGSGSSDPNGDPLTYRWQQMGGVTVTLSGATTISPTFTAPNTSGVLTFTLTVTDTGGLSDSDTVVVTVIQNTFSIYLPVVLNKP